MIKVKFLSIVSTLTVLIACTGTNPEDPTIPDEVYGPPTNQVILSSEINWEQLNPARGDKSPQAGTIWGDRKGSVATGFLAKFVDGFSSPPHIHNVTYRAMVIKGLIHNDDPNAEKMWMPAGSFWTQPAGEVHITAAKGEENIAYVEIDSGPYLVKPTDEAFDKGERPVNVDKDNIVWLDASKTNLIETTNTAAIAFLWEDKQRTGNLLRLSEGFDGEITSTGTEFHAIVISGQADYLMPSSQEIKILDPGSYFTSMGQALHEIKGIKGSESVIYIRTNGEISIR